MQILDCTLRDGGLGLEDLKNYGVKKCFTEEHRQLITKELTAANVDIIEIGSIEKSEHDKRQFAIYQSIEQLSATLPLGFDYDKYAGLFRGPDTPCDEIPYWNENLCKKIRVIIRYSELKKSIEFCAHLASKGFDVCVQPMVTLRYTDDEIEYMLSEANKMGAYAVYFVDSYGYMQSSDIKKFFEKYDAVLNPKIKIGFHAHNNINLASSNVNYLISLAANSKREIIVDSTCMGMGQGAGNMQTEVLVHNLDEMKISDKYGFNHILNVCDIVSDFFGEALWGYSLDTYIPAIYKVAYKFSIALRKKNKCSYAQISDILKNIPEDMRHRYSKENYEKLLILNGLA